MNMNTKSKGLIEKFLDFHNIKDLVVNYKGKQSKGKIARNLVDYEAGKTIFETMLGIVRGQVINQEELF